MSQPQDPPQHDPSTPATSYIPPSISSHLPSLLTGTSYTHSSPIPPNITPNTPTTPGTPVTLGIDEAGRGPVIGPMIYGLAYLPVTLQHTLLSTTHHFDDSKVLTPLVRARLMRTLCTPTTDLHSSVGWSIASLSAQSIASSMLRHPSPYNLNAQAMDATIALIRGVMAQHINVTEIYIDTIGQPVPYQRRLAGLFPTCRVTVEKKADSLFPVVSCASVVAKVSRDVSCEVLYRALREGRVVEDVGLLDGVEKGDGESVDPGWGSGYPSDARCITWLKGNMDEAFGWGSECRFSWSTVKDLLEDKNRAMQVEWAEEDKENGDLSMYFGGGGGPKTEEQELRGWYGGGVEKVF